MAYLAEDVIFCEPHPSKSVWSYSVQVACWTDWILRRVSSAKHTVHRYCGCCRCIITFHCCPSVAICCHFDPCFVVFYVISFRLFSFIRQSNYLSVRISSTVILLLQAEFSPHYELHAKSTNEYLEDTIDVDRFIPLANPCKTRCIVASKFHFFATCEMCCSCALDVVHS